MLTGTCCSWGVESPGRSVRTSQEINAAARLYRVVLEQRDCHAMQSCGSGLRVLKNRNPRSKRGLLWGICSVSSLRPLRKNIAFFAVKSFTYLSNYIYNMYFAFTLCFNFKIITSAIEFRNIQLNLIFAIKKLICHRPNSLPQLIHQANACFFFLV